MTSTPAYAELRRLLRLDFRVEAILDEHGEAEAAYFVREADGWLDVVLVYSLQCARAYRTPTITPGQNPLAAAPKSRNQLVPTGDVVTVVKALLSLNTSPTAASRAPNSINRREIR